MFRRLFWLLIGTGLGFGMSLWLTRALRSTFERYTPERLASDLSEGLRGLGGDLRAAVAEGRVAMRERESELRESLGARR